MSSAPKPRSPPVALALVVAVCAISFAAIFFKKAQPTHPIVAAGIRLAFAGVLLLPLVLRAWARGQLSQRLVGYATLGGLMYALHFGTWVTSLGLTSVAASVTLVTATPLLLGLLGVLTGRDRPHRGLWVALATAFVGVLLIGGADVSFGADALLGDALALGGAAAMAGYLLLARGLGPALNVTAFMGIAVLVSAMCMFLASLAAGIPFRASSDEALMYLALAALIPQLIGHSLLTWSLHHTTPTRVGMATVGEPVVSTLLGWLWLHESVSPLTGAGCLVTLSAVVLALRSRAPGDEPSVNK